MTHRPDSEEPNKSPSIEGEGEQRIKEVQQEQERRLREALGDELYEWLDAFEGDLDVLGQG
jgi:hypothetical protein